MPALIPNKVPMNKGGANQGPALDPNTITNPIAKKIYALMSKHYNVLLIGTHGIGKTSLVLDVATNYLGWKVKFFSAPTMDPYADLGGIPIVDPDTETISFAHDEDLDEYDVFLFDEINRPQNDKILNGLLEIIQFKTAQGRKFYNLKCCWATMNPSTEEYNVIDIDPTLLDRFHAYIYMSSIYDRDFYLKQFGETITNILLTWINSISTTAQKYITPRRLEYIGKLIHDFPNDIDIILSGISKDWEITQAELNTLKNLINSNINPPEQQRILNQQINDVNRDLMTNDKAIKQLILNPQNNNV